MSSGTYALDKIIITKRKKKKKQYSTFQSNVKNNNTDKANCFLFIPLNRPANVDKMSYSLSVHGTCRGITCINYVCLARERGQRLKRPTTETKQDHFKALAM